MSRQPLCAHRHALFWVVGRVHDDAGKESPHNPIAARYQDAVLEGVHERHAEQREENTVDKLRLEEAHHCRCRRLAVHILIFFQKSRRKLRHVVSVVAA